MHGGKIAKKKAKVAVARKLAVVMPEISLFCDLTTLHSKMLACNKFRFCAMNLFGRYDFVQKLSLNAVILC